MSEPGKRTVRKFNPGMMQPDDEVIRQFVVRKSELDILVGILRGNIDSQSCQHALVVGPRGRGKTMLLARVAAEIRTATDLSDTLLPVRLMEESYEVSSTGDFWLEVLFHLGIAVEEDDPNLSRELKKTHDDFATRWQGPEWEHLTCGAVLEAVDRIGKKIVVMVENMQDLCQQADKHFGWKLRKVMQTEPNIMLICSATSRFEALDVEEPFFNIFRTLHLGPLSAVECAKLWEAVAGQPVGAGEIRPLHILTGGSPRSLAVVADFTSDGSPTHLMDYLANLVDMHTEYFRSQLGTLSGHKRRVYIALAYLWQPSSASEVASRARLDIRVVSTMLGRLVADGVVENVSNGTRGRYAVVERLMCIYFKLRRQREGAAVVQRLSRFMSAYYGEWLTKWLGEVLADSTRSNPVCTETPGEQIVRVEGIDGEDQWVGIRDKQELLQKIGKVALDEVASDLRTFDASVYDSILECLGIGDIPKTWPMVVCAALISISERAPLEQPEDVLAVCGGTEKRLREIGMHKHSVLALSVAGTRAIALYGLGDDSKAKNQVVAMYETLHPDSEVMVAAVLKHLMLAISVAAAKSGEETQRSIVDILLSDDDKAEALWPMIVALRIRLGDAVRAPAEVMEIARDIATDIETHKRDYLQLHPDQSQ